ncbi:DMT family transporter [Clostridium sp. WILCCON 0269]|uniref:DMT family transporter n=1 Tax=Candidatus Clostridium eludens TaxID=3381663 RepID=A0ABW8SSA1_9CLOT
MYKKNKDLMGIHIAVFLFGLSGLFGKLLSLPPMIIVFGRVLFSSIFLLILIFYFNENIKLRSYKHYLLLVIAGIILAIHWSTFFKSIQISTVAIGLLTFSTFPVFVTFLEPYFFKEKINFSDIVVAFITFSGIVLVVPEFKLENNLTQGILWGIASGFTYGVLSMLNRKYVKEYSSIQIAFYEQAIAAIVLLPFLFFENTVFTFKDMLLLALLGIVFTGISHSLFINSLKSIKTRTAGIISSLEPVYGIIFATFLLGEIPTLKEVLGGIIILSTVFYSTAKCK